MDNRGKVTATILTSRLDLRSPSSEGHTHSRILRQDNTIDLVRMAQAALRVNDIHTHDEGMDPDQPALSTVPSTPPPTDSVSTSSAPYRQSTANQSTNQANKHPVEERKLAISEGGIAVEPMGIYRGEENNHTSYSVIPRSNDCAISPLDADEDEGMLLDSPETTQRDAPGPSTITENTQESESLSLLLKRNSRPSVLQLSLTSSHQYADASSIVLGSLSTFMETRGVSQPESPVSSPYFSQTKNDNRHKASTPECPPIKTISNETYSQGSLQVIHESPSPENILQGDQASAPALLFLSSSLLKTHTRLIHHLETRTPAPRILYREYTAIPLPKPPIQTTRQTHNIPPEADVIISPTTGIILTTSQAVTQLYLPGHKPNHPLITAIKAINSPLRERIFRLLPRYERLYVLISHTGTAIHTEGNTHPLTKIDVRTLQGISSLSGFCASFSKETTVVPLLVQSSPEIVAEWILGLAAKHRAPVSSTETQTQLLNNVIPEGLHYVHDQESRWEIFLRQIGLNPFAARAVLDMDTKHSAPEDAYGDTTISVLDSREMEPIPFAAFIEMSSERRIARFGWLIGCRVLKRVETAVEPL
ncbi:hypothetical protein N7474_007668 [Penicillium riverlandense]|uniref:uncharacterized protein n=1 Tax=Penicillium riverlandense TaxID=1903569 RepID=UPI002548A741|nr:uncharacterized protein N7474_007668 [Penicillium riverlandense]KAJ5811367.1 hypothetical protein N7474_007668 [Penicillium riverlandense]